ncbi:helix-turn-helix domain-containing protein [Bacillus infantis]|jgi:predicted transcriptional regulator|uniref:helix-turn-helix domain-containing protein n=1 Tax=Bacillus infantis TaxID=324767 RepID=UPI002155D8C5|nr:helix-turn-helix domain-containing protein [Bacillus infantis]MCR6610580.1 helix-turn-helix domain-containing protein [Bacillus infantis]
MKKRIDVIAYEESFHNLSTFQDIEGLNRTVRKYKEEIQTAVKRSDVQVRLTVLLELLKRHSCKQIGVSYMCKRTIAQKMELAYKTIQRLVKKLEDLGMIRQVAMKRKKDMLQTANAIVIIPSKQEVSDKIPLKESGKCPTNKTTSLSLKQKIINTKRKAVAHFYHVDKPIDKANFIAHWVPESFAQLAGFFYSQAASIQEFWKVVKQNNRVINYATGDRAFTKEQELEIGLKAFKEFVMKVKRGVRMVKGEYAYFNGVVYNLMDKLYFEMD